MKGSEFLSIVQDNLAAFLLGWVFGAGLFPMLIEQLTNI